MQKLWVGSPPTVQVRVPGQVPSQVAASQMFSVVSRQRIVQAMKSAPSGGTTVSAQTESPGPV